jgi:hypothetical protein
VLIRFSFALFLLAILAPLRAQDEPVHMHPEFPLIFPLAQNGNDVSVKYPVLINPSTVIKPGMIMRCLYVLSIDAQAAGSSDLALAHKGNLEQSYSRDPAGSSNQPKLPPELAHEIEGYRRTVWQISNNFVLALAQMPTESMHLIYSPKGNDHDLADDRFSFFDGLFVGLPNGKVTVIAVEKESKAEGAGIKAGDEIVSVGGIPTQDSLTTFAAAYAIAKKTAKENEVPSYPMTIRSGGAGDAHEVDLAMPPKITGGLMDDFTTPPPPSKPVVPAGN